MDSTAKRYAVTGGVIMRYLGERRIDTGWGSARHVKAYEYRAFPDNRPTIYQGIGESFRTLREAKAHIAATVSQ